MRKGLLMPRMLAMRETLAIIETVLDRVTRYLFRAIIDFSMQNEVTCREVT